MSSFSANIHIHNAEEIRVEDLYEDGSVPVLHLGDGVPSTVFLTPELAQDLYSKLGAYLQDADMSAAEEAVELFGPAVLG